jgi:hypothetical protein
MPCIKKTQTSASNAYNTLSQEYGTEEECLKAAKEGACCVSLRCFVGPKCLCDKSGGTYFGDGTTCQTPMTQGNFQGIRNDDLRCCWELAQGCTSPKPVVRVVTVTDTAGAISQGTCVANASGSWGVTLQEPSVLYGIQDCGAYAGIADIAVPCWQYQFVSGKAAIILSVVFSIISGQPRWRASINTATQIGSYAPDGANQLVTGYGGAPCANANYWSPASGCYSGTATLYKYIGGSGACSNKWSVVGTVSVGNE